MRLVCPKCGAQYEVPKEVIPDTGRDVQCSSCQHTWFQAHPDHPLPAAAAKPATRPRSRIEPEERPTPRPRSAPPPVEDDIDDEDDLNEPAPEPVAPPPRKALDPEVAEIFREERDHETRRRAAEGGSLETQPDLGLEEPRRRPRTRRPTAPIEPAPATGPAADIDPETVAPPAQEPAPEAAPRRRDRLPDVDEINQTLRSGATTTPREIDRVERVTLDDEDDYDTQPKRGGFSRGFFLVVLLTAVAIAVYAMAPGIAEAVPALAGPLSAYVAAVDAARAWMNEQFAVLMLMLDGYSDGA